MYMAVRSSQGAFPHRRYFDLRAELIEKANPERRGAQWAGLGGGAAEQVVKILCFDLDLFPSLRVAYITI